MSFFGSESAIDLLNIRAEKIQSSLSSDLLNKMMHEKEEDGGSIDSGRDDVILEPVFKTDRQNSKCSSGKSRISKKSRRTSSDNISTPTSVRTRSSSIISTAEENEGRVIHENIKPKYSLSDDYTHDNKSDIDKIFDLVHDLKQKDLDEHKKKIDQQNINENKNTAVKTEPEPEKKEKEYNFKYLSGVKGVTVLNLGNPEDLAKVIVPTKSMKIEPSTIPLRMTRDIQSLVVKTTPIRIYGLDPPLEAEMCQDENVDKAKSIEDPEKKKSHDSDQSKSKTLNSTERSKISLPDTRTTSLKIDSKRSTPFSLKPSASYAGSTNIPKETTPKKLSPLPPIDPAVELICKNWRSNTPISPASVDSSKDTMSSALEARNKRMKKTNQARQQFLFSGPGGLSVDKGRELSEESLNSNILADEGQAERHFIVEKSLSSDQVSQLRHHNHNNRCQKSKSSQSSLFTRLRRGHLGVSRSRVSSDNRHSLGPGNSEPPHEDDVRVRVDGQLDEDIQAHGSQSCPSSPTINRR